MNGLPEIKQIINVILVDFFVLGTKSQSWFLSFLSSWKNKFFLQTIPVLFLLSVEERTSRQLQSG